MPVNLFPPVADQLLPIAGVRIGVVQAGVRKAGRKDVTLMLIEPGASVGGVFTQNRFCAAPVQVCREHLASGHGVRAIVVNTGNANAGTGEEGMMRAQATCIALARLLEVSPEQVLPFSTGVIMEPLPHDKIIQALPLALDQMGQSSWGDLATGIMTTDTVPKAASRQIDVHGKKITVTGISKGSGMIKPNMATMLAFVATDASVGAAALQRLVDAGQAYPCGCSRKEIAQAQAARVFEPIFDTKPEGVSDAEWQSYRDLSQTATTEAIEQMQARTRNARGKFFGERRRRELIVLSTDHERRYTDFGEPMPQIVTHHGVQTTEFDFEAGELGEPIFEKALGVGERGAEVPSRRREQSADHQIIERTAIDQNVAAGVEGL